MSNKIINTANASTPLGAYPHARKVGNLLFLSGIGPRNPKDNSIPGLELDKDGNIVKYDIAAECHAVFANVKAVLEASGSSWDRIIDVTVFLTGSALAAAVGPMVGHRLGPWTIESPLGEGGMASVWLARRSDGRHNG